jgi:hypothetical protein
LSQDEVQPGFLRVAVIRRFNLSDILLVRRLQEKVTCLDLETALLWSPAPLSLALLECLSFTQGRSTTFVEDNHSVDQHAAGFLQAWDRASSLSCDVEFVSPSLDGSTTTAQLWSDLLQHLSVVKGESGLQRIFAKVPDDGQSADVFRHAGFSAYARRHVLQLDGLPQNLPTPGRKHLRPAGEHDASGVKRLRGSLTPRLVQQIEGGTEVERDPTALLPWWMGRETSEYVWEDSGEIRAHLRVLTGQDGHWLRILVEPGASEQAELVLGELLFMVTPTPERPLYCGVREYEGGLRPTLEALGFAPLTSELLMTRQTTAPARIPAEKLSPALEKGVETATPISTSNRCQDTT